MRPEDFIPVDKDIPQPTEGGEMVCPRCGELPFHKIKGANAVVLELEDGSFWPYPPPSKFATRKGP